MKIIGLTGGIGSGKSTVAKVFEVLGIPVFYADAIAKELMNTNKSLIASIKETFGNDIYFEGILDRKKLSAIVFNDPEKLKALNALVHPATTAYTHIWLQQQKAPYALKEAAILFESGAYRSVEKVIGVFAPQEVRIKRAMQRDGISREQVLGRMNNQMNEEEKMKRCDFVILNDGNASLIEQVMQIHAQLLSAD